MVSDVEGVESTVEKREFVYRNKGYLEDIIAQLQYYLHQGSGGEFYSSPVSRCSSRGRHSSRDMRALDGVVPPRTDGTFAITAELARSNLSQSMLIDGINSISVATFLIVKSAVGRVYQPNPEMDKFHSDNLRSFLKSDSMKFTKMFNDAVGDFTLYGSAVAYIDIERKVLVHLPFVDTYFGLSIYGELEWVYSVRERSDFYGRRTILQIIFERDGVGVWTRKETVSVDSVEQEVVRVKYPSKMVPIFVATDGKFGSTDYGNGAGVVALKTIKSLNWNVDRSMSVTELAANPPLIYPQGTRFTSPEGGEGAIEYGAGGLIGVDSTQAALGGASSDAALRILHSTGGDAQYLFNERQYLVDQVQSAFFVDPLLISDGSSAARTATEVRERISQSLTLYKKRAEVFRSELLTPMLRNVLEFMLKVRFKEEENLQIRYFSLDAQRAKQANLENKQASIAFVASVKPDQVTDEDIESFKASSLEEASV